jgi:hypothetical protein
MKGKGTPLNHLFMIMAFCFWALEHNGFEGFENTNPRGQLVGERSHLSCSNIGLGDEILHPHHYTIATGTIFLLGKKHGVTWRVSSQGVAP